MVSIEEFKSLALAFPEAVESPHFDKDSYRVQKKIFATLNKQENRCCIKLSLIDQDVFCAFDPAIIYPVPNKWGKQGWTLINLDIVPLELLEDALTTAYCNVAPAKLAEPYLNRGLE